MRKVYYEENDLDRIITYYEKDTIAVAQLIETPEQASLEIDEILHL